MGPGKHGATYQYSNAYVCMLNMNWKMVIALMLFLPVCWWVELPPLWRAVDMAQHHVECEDDSHCNEVVVHPKSLVDRPAPSADVAIVCETFTPRKPLIALLSDPRRARDHPPPLFYSLSHSLRAPPTLIPA